MQISVIIPTYRPENYLFECLDSLLRQTLDPSLWEVIIVLNGCHEPWYSQITDYLHTHPITNTHLIHTDDAGVSNARNIGIESAKGEYITFIDDDDYVSETYLEQLAQIARPNIIAISYTKAFSDTQDYVPYYIEQEYKHRAVVGEQPYYKAKKYFGGPCMKLIHRDIIGQTRFDTRYKNGEDSLFMFAISNRISNIRFTNTDAVYYRRFRTGSASLGQQRSKALQNRLSLIKAYNQLYWKNPKAYNLYFYLTRIIASLHAIIIGK